MPWMLVCFQYEVTHSGFAPVSDGSQTCVNEKETYGKWGERKKFPRLLVILKEYSCDELSLWKTPPFVAIVGYEQTVVEWLTGQSHLMVASSQSAAWPLSVLYHWAGYYTPLASVDSQLKMHWLWSSPSFKRSILTKLLYWQSCFTDKAALFF